MKNETARSFFIFWGKIRLNLIFNVLQNWKSEKWIMKNESLCSVLILSKIDKWQIKICIQFSFFFNESKHEKDILRPGSRYGGPNLFICALVMFLNRVFRQEWFNRFLWFLASLIKNGRTLRKCYLFSYRWKNVWAIGICLKPHFFKKCQ